MDDRAFLRGVDVGREDDVGVFAQALGQDGRVGHDEPRLGQGAAPQLAVGLVTQRVGLE